MKRIEIKKGLNLPLTGSPQQVITPGNVVEEVALCGTDYIGLKPRFEVAVGDKVKIGQLLFVDKRTPAVRFTSPGSGEIIAINRGEKRRFLSIVIKLSGDESLKFASYKQAELMNLSSQQIKDQLLQSGLWTSLRARPFGRIADPETKPHSIFCTCFDTNPLAPDLDIILKGRENDFRAGLEILSALTDGKLYICQSENQNLPVIKNSRLSKCEFKGPHPAGNVGTHIHFLDPVNRKKTVWHIGAQDVCAVGSLFLTGIIDVKRVVSLAGSEVENPILISTRIGASLSNLTKDKLTIGKHRIISGSVLSGVNAVGPLAFLGRYHQQISVIPEFKGPSTFTWLSPGRNRFSVKNIFLSCLSPKRKLSLSTAANGGLRAIIPIESYEKVMPLDLLPNYLLRALAVDDIEEAEKLGCLELEEEDLACCTFVCPSKIDHAANLRRNLTLIEKEG